MADSVTHVFGQSFSSFFSGLIPESECPFTLCACPLALFPIQRFRDAEAEIIASPRRCRVRCAAARRALHIGVACEGAGPEYAVRAIAFGIRAAIDGRMREILFITILHPLEDIAVHVVQAPCIRRERS